MAVPLWVKQEIDGWLDVAGIEKGPIFRRVLANGQVGKDALTERAVWQLVREYAAQIGRVGKDALSERAASAPCTMANGTVPVRLSCPPERPIRTRSADSFRRRMIRRASGFYSIPQSVSVVDDCRTHECNSGIGVFHYARDERR